MKKIIFSAALAMFFSNVKSQIGKGYWLVGGNGSYSYHTSSGIDASNGKHRVIEIMPNIGYFVIDKLAIGIKLNTTFTKQKHPQIDGTTTSNNQNIFGAGPFVRYYFLGKDNRINIFSDANIYYSLLTSKNPGNPVNKSKELDYSLSAGSVIFLNTAVGLEFILGYNNSSAYGFDAKGESISFKVGFQIHLEKR